jgi:hypothetical protein
VPPVPVPGQPVHRALPTGHLDRRGPVTGGEAVPAAEAGHVADVADDGRGDDRGRPRTAWSGWCRPRRRQQRASSWSRAAARRCGAGHRARPQPARSGPPPPPGRPVRPERRQDPADASCGDRPGGTAGDQPARCRVHRLVQPAGPRRPAWRPVAVWQPGPAARIAAGPGPAAHWPVALDTGGYEHAPARVTLQVKKSPARCAPGVAATGATI